MDIYYTEDHNTYTLVRDGVVLALMQGPLAPVMEELGRTVVVGPVPADVTRPAWDRIHPFLNDDTHFWDIANGTDNVGPARFPPRDTQPPVGRRLNP